MEGTLPVRAHTYLPGHNLAVESLSFRQLARAAAFSSLMCIGNDKIIYYEQ